ncbi:hypothetical protein PUV54_02915 [Hyphococcus flavus]|uniref:Uncharacterized protein n=1 Tax=Hyphococcus flavus TaxID=1866326 RepID=A0AAF0CHP5_9PROT|nr:hypothetical protein [Hyphococcus flavus]WDI32142.1 hypothetical protein PUV54_02915 [Hyphococcus flavus]
MSLSPQKKERLSAFLGELPVAAAVKLFAAVEADRAGGGEGLPHDDILNDLRAALKARGGAPPNRPPDAKRTFFTPFEDYFVSIRTGKKRKAQIARTSLDPIWRIMMTDQAMTETALAAAALDDAYAAGRETKQLISAMFLAAEAGLGRLCGHAAKSTSTREALIAELGDEAAMQDLEEIHSLMEGVDMLRALRSIVPSHSPSLTEEQYYQLRQLFLSAHEQSAQLGEYMLLALKGRLESPWRALGVYYHLARSADEKLAAAREAISALPESLFEDLEGMARVLERSGSAPLHAQTVLARLSYFADFADGLANHAAKAGDNVFLNRIEACRDIAGEAHERFSELALATMRAVMPVRVTRGSARLSPPRPDFSKPLNAEMIDDARRASMLIAAAPENARRLGAEAGAVRALVEDACNQARTYANDLVAEIRAAEGAERDAAKRLLTHVLTVVAPLLKSDEIGLIRDRAAAAAVTA